MLQRPQELPKPQHGGLVGEFSRAYMSSPNPPGGGTPPQPTPLDQAIGQVVDKKIAAHEQAHPHLTQQDVQKMVRRRTAPDAQDIADAINQNPQPVAQALQQQGLGQQANEQQVKTWAQDVITEQITNGALATTQEVADVGQRVDSIEQRMPAGNDLLITEAEVQGLLTNQQLSNAQKQSIADLFEIPVADLNPANFVTRIQALSQGGALSQAQLNQIATALGLPTPTPAGFDQRAGAVATNVFNRLSWWRRLWGPRTPAPANPAIPPAPNGDVIARRTLLIGGGIGLAAVGIGGMAWLIGHSRPDEYPYPPLPTPTPLPPSGNATAPPTEPTPIPTGLDYNSMTPSQASVIINNIDNHYPHTSPPDAFIDTVIPAGQVGIITGWQVVYDDKNLVQGDTTAFREGTHVHATTGGGGRWRLVPSNIARSTFVAIVVYTKSLQDDMNHTEPLPEWNLPPYP